MKELLELLILKSIVDDYYDDEKYKKFLDKHYDVRKMFKRFQKLGNLFLNEYALNKSEKSE